MHAVACALRQHVDASVGFRRRDDAAACCALLEALCGAVASASRECASRRLRLPHLQTTLAKLICSRTGSTLALALELFDLLSDGSVAEDPEIVRQLLDVKADIDAVMCELARKPQPPCVRAVAASVAVNLMQLSEDSEMMTSAQAMQSELALGRCLRGGGSIVSHSTDIPPSVHPSLPPSIRLSIYPFIHPQILFPPTHAPSAMQSYSLTGTRFDRGMYVTMPDPVSTASCCQTLPGRRF
eukprot:359619-Chlamydomonas_euryale.AAC.1